MNAELEFFRSYTHRLGSKMSESDSLVSIIMPMRNTERFVSAALHSVLAARDVALEVIIVDDKSSDRSATYVRNFRDERIRLIEGEGYGAARAMNRALAEVRGEIVMCCDSDDLYPAARITQQVKWLRSHPEYDAVCGSFSTIDSNGNSVAALHCGDDFADITNELLSGKVRTHLCAYAIRTRLARKVGGFREYFESGYDVDFQLRIGEEGRIAYVPNSWYVYRIHESSIIHTQPSVLRKFFEQTAYDLQRQRQEIGVDDLQRGCAPPKPVDDRSPPFSAKSHIQGHLLGRAWQEHRSGKKIRAVKVALRALAADPFQTYIWRSVIALVLKPNRKPPA
jgi:glycosyltransferase involved in cell wall biosynthesis